MIAAHNHSFSHSSNSFVTLATKSLCQLIKESACKLLPNNAIAFHKGKLHKDGGRVSHMPS